MKIKLLKLYFSKISFFISLFLISLFSCKKKPNCEITEFPVHYNLIEPTQADLSWIQFNNGDTLIFKSNLGVFDSMIYDIPTGFSYVPISTGSWDECKTYDIPEFKTFGLREINSLILAASLISPNSELNYQARFTWENNGLNTLFANKTFSSSSFNTLLIDTITYINVYEFSIDTSILINGMTWQVYYQKEHGLLRYDQVGGMKWEGIN